MYLFKKLKNTPRIKLFYNFCFVTLLIKCLIYDCEMHNSGIHLWYGTIQNKDKYIVEHCTFCTCKM